MAEATKESPERAHSEHRQASEFPYYLTEGCGTATVELDTKEIAVVLSFKALGIENYYNMLVPIDAAENILKMLEHSIQEAKDRGASRAN